ncbi:hypothetical protein Q1695_002576 [Nippostrongylus brasiliensis]|nr:hypothetical protein Q1695_002576 [Nippostrongylus brasiliensis]
MSQKLDFAFLPVAVAFALTATVGIVGNSIMVIATFKARRMNSPCHLLIALTCFMDLIHEIGEYPIVYHYFQMTRMVQNDCFWMQFLPLIGACAASPLILMLGLDRFIAISYPPRLVQCSMPEAFGHSAFAQLSQIGFGINVAIVVIYMVTFFNLRRREASTKKRRAFKSIFVTVIIVLCGWMFTLLVNTFSVYITDKYLRVLIIMYAGITVNIGLMSNVFAFYAINTEYRDVIRQMFCKQRKVQKGHEIGITHGLADCNVAIIASVAATHR